MADNSTTAEQNVLEGMINLWRKRGAEGSGTKHDPYKLTPQNSPDGYFDVGKNENDANSAATSQMVSVLGNEKWFDLAGGSLMANSSGTWNGYLNPPPDTSDNHGLDGSYNPDRGAVFNDSEIWFAPYDGKSGYTKQPFNATINIDVQQNNPSGFLIYASTHGWYDWSVEWWPPGEGPDGAKNTDGECIVKITYEGNGRWPDHSHESSITVNIHGNPWDIPKDQPHYKNSSEPGEYPGQGRGPWHVENEHTGQPNGPLDIGTKKDKGWHIYSPWGPWPVPCFLKGAMITTPKGLVPVEQLKEGDEVCVFPSGEARRILALKEAVRRVPANVPFPDEAGWPVLVEKDALAPNVPDQDLRVTPEHCLFLEGAFIPVRMLVNNRSIRFDFSESVYTYYHFKLEKHSVVQANNLLTESWLGNEESWEEGAAAPLRTDRFFVEPIWRKIFERAELKEKFDSEAA